MKLVSRDALLRTALLASVWVFYCIPLHVLHATGFIDHHASIDASQRVLTIRLWLGFATTLVALLGVLSTPLLIATCIHATLAISRPSMGISECPLSATDLSSGSADLYSKLPPCTYEIMQVLAYGAVLRFVLLPPPSSLSTLRRHSRQLKRFFQQHDPKYTGLVDCLLDDYTGNERLLFARIRKIYHPRTASSPSLRMP